MLIVLKAFRCILADFLYLLHYTTGNHWLYLYYSLKRMRKRELKLNSTDKKTNIRNNGKS